MPSKETLLWVLVVSVTVLHLLGLNEYNSISDLVFLVFFFPILFMKKGE